MFQSYMEGVNNLKQKVMLPLYTDHSVSVIKDPADHKNNIPNPLHIWDPLQKGRQSETTTSWKEYTVLFI